MAGIYLHFPFCKTKCLYCSFYSEIDRSQQQHVVDAMCKEIELRSSALVGTPISTIYLGGGTPSLLTNHQFIQLFDTVYSHFEVAKEVEITMEINPDDATFSQLQFWRKKVNRLSVGIQSFHDSLLQLLHRRHTAQEAIEAVKMAQKADFTNCSIDLIYGIPGMSLGAWKEIVQTAISLNITHISAYALSIEEGAALYELVEKGEVKTVSDEMYIQQYDMLKEMLTTHGIAQYEISNFAKPTFRSRHNSSYWEGEHYIGIGPSAHSYDGVERRYNYANSAAYVQNIRLGKNYFESEVLSEIDHYNELVMTRIRVVEGIDFSTIEKQFSSAMSSYFLSNVSQEIVQGNMVEERGFYMLTAKGFHLADGITRRLFYI